MSSLSPQQTADAVRAHMSANDPAPRMLGIAVTSIAPGAASATMTVRDDMLNGHAICHGGLVATLADTCFAYACNAYDETTVASGFAIELLAPARAGDVLTASAVEVARGGRSGLYDVTVVDQRGTRIAVFRGRSHTFRDRPVVPRP